MPEYRRAYCPGGTFFLTLVTADRRPLFQNQRAQTLLHEAISVSARERPFSLLAIVLLWDHLHLMLSLGDNDFDFSTRIKIIKLRFSHRVVGENLMPISTQLATRREVTVWQQRFWEHTIRDIDDLNRHFDYIHYNPVKHGYVTCPHQWQFSSFHRCVEDHMYSADWCCCCGGKPQPPDFGWAQTFDME